MSGVSVYLCYQLHCLLYLTSTNLVDYNNNLLQLSLLLLVVLLPKPAGLKSKMSIFWTLIESDHYKTKQNKHKSRAQTLISISVIFSIDFVLPPLTSLCRGFWKPCVVRKQCLLEDRYFWLWCHSVTEALACSRTRDMFTD